MTLSPMPLPALHWIVGLLRHQDIPFLVCGGLAAIGYGSRRELNDIDLFVPGHRFPAVVQAGQAHITKPAGHYREEGWDLTYVQFRYHGIKIEVGNADNARIYHRARQCWMPLPIDFARYEIIRLCGLGLPLMSRDDLIAYKSALARPVDGDDLQAMQAAQTGAVR